MTGQADGGQEPAKFKQLSLVLQIIGASDIVLGLGLALLGPVLIGGDPALDGFFMLMGGVFIFTGGGMIWWARSRYGASRPGKGTTNDSAKDGGSVITRT